MIQTDRPKRGRKPKKDKPKRGRPRINPISIMSMIWITLMTMGLCETNTNWNRVDAKVFLCSGAFNKLPIDIESICREKIKDITEASRLEQIDIDEEIKASGEIVQKRKKEWSINSINDDFINLDVYTKEMHSVIGTGTQCYKTKVTWTFQQSVLGTKMKSSIQGDSFISDFECTLMASTKRCGENLMNCNGDHCNYVETPIEDYSIFGPIIVHTTNCRTHRRTITAENADAHLFGTSCKVSDLSCKLPESIIVWDKSVIKYCPFRRIIKNTEFQYVDGGFTSVRHNLRFQPQKVETWCGHKLILTKEGLYVKCGIINDAFYKSTDLPAKEEVDLKRITELTLATIDYGMVVETEDTKRQKEIACTALRY
jgi:hypothetical protein